MKIISIMSAKFYVEKIFAIDKNNYICNMEQTEVINNIKTIAQRILPDNSSLYLYGSRARGNARPDSDWDLLVLIDKDKITGDDYDMVYPFFEYGVDIGQYISTHVYTKKQWQSWTFLPFYHNVEHDKIVLK